MNKADKNLWALEPTSQRGDTTARKARAERWRQKPQVRRSRLHEASTPKATPSKDWKSQGPEPRPGMGYAEEQGRSRSGQGPRGGQRGPHHAGAVTSQDPPAPPVGGRVWTECQACPAPKQPPRGSWDTPGGHPACRRDTWATWASGHPPAAQAGVTAVCLPSGL